MDIHLRKFSSKSYIKENLVIIGEIFVVYCFSINHFFKYYEFSLAVSKYNSYFCKRSHLEFS